MKGYRGTKLFGLGFCRCILCKMARPRNWKRRERRALRRSQRRELWD